MILGTPVVPPESWKVSTSSVPTVTPASRARAWVRPMESMSASKLRVPDGVAPRATMISRTVATSAASLMAKPLRSNALKSD
jgi:hypothetical protein